MTRKFILFSFLVVALSAEGTCQQIEKDWLNQNDTTSGYYLTIKPASMRVQGVLLILESYGNPVDDFLAESKIPNVAYANEILTVCIPTGQRLFLDSSMIGLLNRISSGILENYKLKKDQFAIGGMSIGGTIALRYAELCREKPEEYPILPKAVFAVDAPVDLIGMYKSTQKELKTNYPGYWVDEYKMIIDRLNQELGDPTKDAQKFDAVSPFNSNKKEPGNERFLKDVAFRTYHDVDINWYLQNRRRSLDETTMVGASELVNRLLLQGNDNAEFVSSKITGRRSNGVRRPNSWNIVDEIDLVQWIKEKLFFYPDHIEKPFVNVAPDNWNKELIVFPLDFAPSIPYHGFEELRFAPGWGDSSSYQKWAYSIVWWLNDSVSFSEDLLKANLESYYSGLTKRRILADKQDTSAYRPAQGLVQKTTTLKGDLETYYATVFIYDAQVTRKPGELYFKIHVKDCADKSKTLLFIEVAENSYIAPIWLELDKLNEEFKCVK
jgi:hypothetical protein